MRRLRPLCEQCENPYLKGLHTCARAPRRLKPYSVLGEALSRNDRNHIEQAVRFAFMNVLHDLMQQEGLEGPFRAALNKMKLDDPAMGERPWGDVFRRVMMNKKVSKKLDVFVTDLADTAMRYVEFGDEADAEDQQPTDELGGR